MKYIRTQAGIYEIKNGKFLGNFDVEKYSRDFPVRFADNIEELCDEFVIPDFDNPLYASDRLDVLEAQHRYGGYDVYGAIWTDKGLIYVVKMNDEGEWVAV